MTEKYVIFKVYSGDDPLFWGHHNAWCSRNRFPDHIKEMGFIKTQFIAFVMALVRVETSIFKSKDIHLQKFKDRLSLRGQSDKEVE